MIDHLKQCKRSANQMGEERLIIKVLNNELSIKRAQKEALKAKKKGQQYAFDLRDIKDREIKKDFYMYL